MKRLLTSLRVLFCFIVFVLVATVPLSARGIRGLESIHAVHVSSGWNLMSLPASVSNGVKDTLFPSAVSSAYSFSQQTGYQVRDTLLNGVGFWLRFDSSETVPIQGDTILRDTIEVQAGWNIIGSLSVSIAVDSIRTEPPGTISGQIFYGYAPGVGYQQADTLRPGLGYWIKANQSGSIVLSNTNMLYLRVGDPATWTIPGGARSQYAEIQRWRAASFSVTTQNLTTTIITEDLLRAYQVLKITCPEGGAIGRSITSAEATAINAWVRNGGRLFAEVTANGHTPFVTPFGIDSIEGQAGGPSGLSWYFHGAPLTFGPISGPYSAVSEMACEVMDHPVLQSGNSLTIASTIGGYPAMVYGEFAAGKVVVVFVGGWSWDATSPTNAYRANIFLSGNLQFLANVINYLAR